jgi:hypothetical protein
VVDGVSVERERLACARSGPDDPQPPAARTVAMSSSEHQKRDGRPSIETPSRAGARLRADRLVIHEASDQGRDDNSLPAISSSLRDAQDLISDVDLATLA